MRYKTENNKIKLQLTRALYIHKAIYVLVDGTLFAVAYVRVLSHKFEEKAVKLLLMWG